MPVSKLGLCFHKPVASNMGVYTTSYLLVAIAGSKLQYRGMAHGLLFDPDSMETLVRVWNGRRASKEAEAACNACATHA